MNILDTKIYNYIVYGIVIFSFIAMPFLMFGFKTYYIVCPDNTTIEIINYTSQHLVVHLNFYIDKNL